MIDYLPTFSYISLAMIACSWDRLSSCYTFFKLCVLTTLHTTIFSISLIEDIFQLCQQSKLILKRVRIIVRCVGSAAFWSQVKMPCCQCGLHEFLSFVLSWKRRFCVVSTDLPKWHVGCWYANMLSKYQECQPSFFSSRPCQTTQHGMLMLGQHVTWFFWHQEKVMYCSAWKSRKEYQVCKYAYESTFFTKNVCYPCLGHRPMSHGYGWAVMWRHISQHVTHLQIHSHCWQHCDASLNSADIVSIGAIHANIFPTFLCKSLFKLFYHVKCYWKIFIWQQLWCQGWFILIMSHFSCTY